MSDQATTALDNIPGPMLAWLILGAGAAITVAGIGIATAVIAARRWWRGRARLRDLMDRGDGQGGIPPIARRLSQADAQTEAISMRDIVVRPQLEDICPQFCDNLAEVGDPASCGCAGPCGRAWCSRLRNPVPVTWTEREEGVR